MERDIALQRNEGQMKDCRLICRSLGVWVAVQSAAWGQPTLQGIGFLPGSDSPIYSDANGISADGSVVVGRASSATGVDAFRWTVETGIVSLGSLPGGSGSIAEEVSGDGSVIVGWGDSPDSGSNVEAFRWTAETGMVGLGDLPGDYFISKAYGVSGDGAVVVGWSSADPGPEAFRWTAETGMVSVSEGCSEIDFLTTTARAVSADGLVIVGRGGTCEPGGAQAFRWTAGEGPVGIGVLSGGEWADAYDVSPDGSAIVGRSDSADGSQAFRWTADEGMIALGDLPGGLFDSWAFGVSGDGSVVVGLSCVAGGPLFCSGLDAYIWDAAHGMRNLHDVLEVGYGFDLGGWDFAGAVDVSADGLVIVGSGGNPDGQWEGWILRLPDCNGNGIADDLDILDGVSADDDLNFIPDECECPADFNADGQVGAFDIAFLLNAWGPCAPDADCRADFNHDARVGAFDLAVLLGNWGPCP